jgi:hypothetical protein
MNYKIERRNFLGYLIKGTTAVFLFSLVPFQKHLTKRKNENKINIKIHPLAVKRERKGLIG